MGPPLRRSTAQRAGRDYSIAFALLTVGFFATWSSWGPAAGVAAFLGLALGILLLVRRRTKELDEVLGKLVEENSELTVELENRRFADERQREYVESLEVQRTKLEEELTKAELSVRVKNDFLARVSHEIRTPMASVVGMLELLMATELDSEQRDFGRSIQDSLEGLSKTLDDILDVSKFESGTFELEDEEFDLHHCLEGVLGPLYKEACDKGLDLTYLVDPGVPASVQGSGSRLRQILRNLIGSAIRFTESGSVHLVVHELRRTQRFVRIEFIVRDTGSGLPQDVLAEPFANAYSRQEHGAMEPAANLGLAISRKLAALMGGELEVGSTAGEGTTVRFSAQFRRVAGDDLGTTEDLHGRRILMADPNSVTRKILRIYLEAWGVLAEETSVEEALQALQQARDAGSPFDILVLASDSVSAAARALAQRIKAEPGDEGTRLLLIYPPTGGSHPALLSRSGFDAWLSKPIGPARLRKALDYVLLSPSRESGLGEQCLPRSEFHPAPQDIDVLLVEDNLVNQKVGALLLRRCGCRVAVAGNGMEAVTVVQRGEFDLIFMDCQMPVMDGLEATRAIRSLDGRRSVTPIVALTANTAPNAKTACLEAGMNDYLAKPVRLHQVQEMLEKWGQKAGRAADHAVEETDMREERDPGALDGAVLEGLKLLGGDDDPGLFAELVELFLQDTPPRIEALTKALESADAQALERAAHALKSSSANLGALVLSSIFKDLELAGREGDLAQASTLIGKSTHEYERVRRALRAQLA